MEGAAGFPAVCSGPDKVGLPGEQKEFAMRRAGARGFSLIEIAVVVGLLAVLLAIGGYSFSRYRGHAAVNTAAETAEGVLVRAKEEAKASGFALSDDLRTNGVGTAAPSGPFGSDGAIAVRLRKRYRAGQPLQVVATKDLSLNAPITVEVSGAGTIDIDTDTSQEGVFFEILLKSSNGTQTMLATIPVEVNGEMVFQGSNPQAVILFRYGSYSRGITLTRRGVIEPDRR